MGGFLDNVIIAENRFNSSTIGYSIRVEEQKFGHCSLEILVYHIIGNI